MTKLVRFMLTLGLIFCPAGLQAQSLGGQSFAPTDQPSPALSDGQRSVSDEDLSIELIVDGNAPTFTVPGNLYILKSVELSAKEPGIVEKIIELGQPINAGETIFALDNQLMKAQISAAEKELSIARLEAENNVDLRFAKVSSEVNEQVLNRSVAANRQYKKAISQTEIERLRLDLERSKLSAEQAERTSETNRLNEQLKREQLNIAEIQLSSRTIDSPITGIVTDVSVSKGEWVNAGQPVARIVQTNKLRFSGFADSREILPNQIAARAMIKVESTNGRTGIEREVRVTFINPEIDPASGLFEIRAEVDNAKGRLFSGMKSSLVIREQ